MAAHTFDLADGHIAMALLFDTVSKRHFGASFGPASLASIPDAEGLLKLIIPFRQFTADNFCPRAEADRRAPLRSTARQGQDLLVL